MATFSAIRDGLQARLLTISGLRVADTLPDKVNPPMAVIGPGEPLRRPAAFGGTVSEWNVLVRLFVARTAERAGQDKLDSYVDASGTNSIEAAVAAEKTLGGAVDYMQFVEVRRYGEFRVADVGYLGCEFVFAAMTSS